MRKSLKYCVLLLICKLFQGVLTDTRGCTQIQTRTNAATAQRHSERLVRSQSTREYTLAPSPTPAPTAARASEQPPSGWCIRDLTLRCGHLYLTSLSPNQVPSLRFVRKLMLIRFTFAGKALPMYSLWKSVLSALLSQGPYGEVS